MAINKVVYGDNTLIDLTEDSVTENDVKKGVTFHSADGEARVGKSSGEGGTTIIDTTPVGTVISYMGKTAPENYLACNGAIYNIADFSDLAEHIKTNFGSYDFFGGNGTTTFAVPDLRGEFLRGTGTNSHTTEGNGSAVGVHQNATQHIYNYMVNGRLSAYYREGESLYPTYYDKLNTSSDFVKYLNAYNYNTGVSASSKYTYGTSRPTNTSVYYAIKYTNDGIVSTDVATDEEVQEVLS